MNKAELWDELKSYLVKAVPQLYDMAFKAGYHISVERLTNKARGMDLALIKMNELERDLLDKQEICIGCSNCDNHWYHYDGTNTGKFCWLESDGKECIANNFKYHALKKGEN